MAAQGICPRCGGNLFEIQGELRCDTCFWPDEEDDDPGSPGWTEDEDWEDEDWSGEDD